MGFLEIDTMITRTIFESHLNCKYKAYLQQNPDTTKKEMNDYAHLVRQLDEEYRSKCRFSQYGEYSPDYLKGGVETKSLMTNEAITIVNATLVAGEFEVSIDGIEKIRGKSTYGSHHYQPILFTRKSASAFDKLVLGFFGLVLLKMQDRAPEYGTIISGDTYKRQRIRLPKLINLAKKEIETLTKRSEPVLFLNQHCRQCEFQGYCFSKAKDRDDLSLLRLSNSEIKAFQAKGVFTVNQLSHTYRVRRRPENSKPKSYPALRAMAIRDAKVYITDTPVVPTTPINIFFDVEGMPDDDIYYLIGVLIKERKHTRKYSFWAKNSEDERKIWFELLSLLRGFKNYTLYHYGDYERLFFDKMRKRYRLTSEDAETFDAAKKSMRNAVSMIYGRIYFPTYSNSLKEIGKFCGANWSVSEANGTMSIAWRTIWEASKQNDFKTKLITYNMEDCVALMQVVNFIGKISAPKERLSLSVDGKDIKNANEIPSHSIRKWGANSFLITDLDLINKCAYFDYQSTKIFLRDKQKRKKTEKRRNRHISKSIRANKTIILEPPPVCPKCASDFTYKHSVYFKAIIDLKFTSGGVKKWVVKYGGRRRRCRKCRHLYVSKKYPIGGSSFGYNLKAFVVYLNIALRMSFGEIRDYFNSVFGLKINSTILSKMKQNMAQFYGGTVRELMRTIKNGNLIQVDETNARLDGAPCYVWVFTTLSEVVYLYAATRKGDILHKHLRNFKGVLVSDFYTAYDSVPCRQQKCLIHLIRDLNDDLFKNQLNQEFKELIQAFATLVKQIVSTIDKKGLRARYLSKHKKDVKRFFGALKKIEYKTDVAQQYQKRLLKTADRLFTFLDYDNVPWNNNYAENAIKTFAEFRHKFNPYFQKNGLDEYLVLLSLQHSCKLRKIDFLKFLLSKRKRLQSS